MILLFRHLRAPAVGAALLVSSNLAVAQQPQPSRPTEATRQSTDQSRALLQARPELLQQLRQRLLNSGLTREQIRARLRAEGYPENFLDAYLPGGSGDAAAPTDELFSALQELGLADSTDVAFLRRIQFDTSRTFRDSLRRRDSTAADSAAILRRRMLRADVADSLARLDSGYIIFGLEALRSDANAQRFDPMLAGPVDANYRIGPGDRLVLVLTGDVEAAHSLDVTREGFVVIPQVGQIDVANLTMAELNDLLYVRLGRVYSGVRRGPAATTRFSVSMARLRANQIFVLGDVQFPGSYMVSSAGTAVTAIYAAGGPTVNGGLRAVQIRRGSQLVGTLDLYDYLLRGDASQDVRLQTGDVVFVPPRGHRIRVVGEVVRPATYEMKSGESLLDAIRAAGGFRADASRRRVHVERIVPPQQRTQGGPERITIDVELGRAGEEQLARVPIEGGDVVHVFPVTERLRNTIRVLGNVRTPGPQGLEPGMRIVDAIRRAGGPLPDVYLDHVLITRRRADSTFAQLRAALRDSLGTVIGDFLLQEDDEIELFSTKSFRPDRTVAIGGAVREGGLFPYRSGMTIRDLLLLAGGLEEDAYLVEAEVARIPSDRGGPSTATTIRVPLDSSYLFEARPGGRYEGAPGVPARASGAPEFELKAYDNVLILRTPGWEQHRVVTIDGEVRFPGKYALKNRTERVADLIGRAGGFTSEAYPEGARFTRRRDDVGRVAVDLPRAMSRRNSPDNLLLVDGDSIVIPQRSDLVTVRGAVNAPNVVAYVHGMDMFYYIDQAGGGARNGDLRRAFITQPNGKREVRSIGNRSPRPMPGALVIVPELDPADRVNVLQLAASIAPVLASLVTLIVALR